MSKPVESLAELAGFRSADLARLLRPAELIHCLTSNCETSVIISPYSPGPRKLPRPPPSPLGDDQHQ